MANPSHPFVPAARYVARGVLAALPQVLADHVPGKKLLLLADATTYSAAGAEVEAAIGAQATVQLHHLGAQALAELGIAKAIIPAAEGCDGVLALGSGTINDLAKYAAHAANKPYISIATAASMNGYTSSSASLKENHLKQSHPCRAPVAVVADIDIVAAAPRRMAKAGLGDTLARSTVESDALLSHLLFQTPYEEHWFKKLRAHEAVLIHEVERFKLGEPTYFATLMEALLDAGDAMAETGSSAIASQSEHMLVHAADLLYPDDLQDFLHGELVALFTLIAARLQQKMLVSPPELKPLYTDEMLFARYFGATLGGQLQQQYRRKSLDAGQIAALQTRLAGEWESIKQRITAIQQPALTLERLYLQLALPTTHHDIRLDAARWQAVLTYAHYTRDRFTFLDLAAMAGKRPK